MIIPITNTVSLSLIEPTELNLRKIKSDNDQFGQRGDYHLVPCGKFYSNKAFDPVIFPFLPDWVLEPLI